jgi:outer membrane protein assembly factor BamB
MRQQLRWGLLFAVLVAGCSTGHSPVATTTPAEHNSPGASVPTQSTAWPAALPRDGVQPRESTDAGGHVVPAARSSSSVNGQSSFASGEQSFASGGTVSTVGDAAHLESGNAGSHALSFATYRLTLGGSDGTIYFGNDNDSVYALTDNGTPTPDIKWTYTASSGIPAPPAVGNDGAVIVGTADGTVLALADNGTPTPTLKWQFNMAETVGGPPEIGADGTVYVTSDDNSIYALAGNGSGMPTVKWSYTAADDSDASPAIGPDGTVYIGSFDDNLYAFGP